MTTSSYSPVFGRLTACAGVLGALCLLLSTVLFTTDGGGINDGVLGGTVGVWAAIGMAIGSVGILRLIEPRAPVTAPLVGAIALAAFSGGVAFNIQALYQASYDIDFLSDATGGTGSGNDWFGIFAFLPWGLMTPLTFVLIGWLLWRTHMSRPSVAAMFALGGILFVSGRPARIDAIAIATDAILLLAFVSIAPALLRGGRRPGPLAEEHREGTEDLVTSDQHDRPTTTPRLGRTRHAEHS